MAETQTPPQQQATWQPPLYDPPPSSLANSTRGTVLSSSPYPPLQANDSGRGVAADKGKAASFVTNASNVDEERGLLSGHAVGEHQAGFENQAGKSDLLTRGRGDWLQTWRENKRLILVRTPPLRLRPVTQNGTEHYNPGIWYRSAWPASWSCCSQSQPSSSASQISACFSAQS